MVDRTSGVPAYRQVADQLAAQISTGELAPGAPLPSERELVDLFGISRPMVREAVKLLRMRGLVDVEHGRGAFVRTPGQVVRLSRNRLTRAARSLNKGAFLGDADAAGFTPSVSVRVRVETADERVARLLEIEPGNEVLVRDRVMSANGLVVQLAVSRLPRDVTLGTALEEIETGPGGAYARLEQAGHVLVHFDETVSARMPSVEEQAQLQLPEAIPVIAVTRVAYTADRPVEMNDMVLAANRYELHYRLPAE
ncbi:GntR family transcriptional regulator [Actinocrispum wychmicini]|uniref:GntR family transcriptional regulator n=1 Tax=Actinocrispum wychmicini TaxID=1213861 RepID=A0A4R2JJX9_9PSEU|nr:GntR family transcriptional regulator [Actinocrispum wychmicini]TCO57328.1 GntR family transcriptional regulator [Actinocrispum wychmicini]